MATSSSLILVLITSFLCGYFMACIFQFLSHSMPEVSNNYKHKIEFSTRNEVNSGTKNLSYHQNDTSLSSDGFKTRILCMVMTAPNTLYALEKRIQGIQETWGRRCNILLFMSSQPKFSLPIISLNVSKRRNHLWAKTKVAFKYARHHYIDDADWFLKTDDTNYVIVENLRHFLSSYNSSQPFYFGCKFKSYVKQGFMNGEAGYVLSKEAVRRFVDVAVIVNKGCRRGHNGNEDEEIGRCLETVGVVAGDSRDGEGRARFIPLPVDQTLFGGLRKFLYEMKSYYRIQAGFNCCSDISISFRVGAPNQMYVMEYLIYHLRPYGIVYRYENVK